MSSHGHHDIFEQPKAKLGTHVCSASRLASEVDLSNGGRVARAYGYGGRRLQIWNLGLGLS